MALHTRSILSWQSQLRILYPAHTYIHCICTFPSCKDVHSGPCIRNRNHDHPNLRLLYQALAESERTLRVPGTNRPILHPDQGYISEDGFSSSPVERNRSEERAYTVRGLVDDDGDDVYECNQQAPANKEKINTIRSPNLTCQYV